LIRIIIDRKVGNQQKCISTSLDESEKALASKIIDEMLKQLDSKSLYQAPPKTEENVVKIPQRSIECPSCLDGRLFFDSFSSCYRCNKCRYATL
jgi:hypothetical protein